MQIRRLVAPADAVVSLERAKQHLNIDTGHYDAKIGDLVAQATAWLDGERGVLGRCLMPQTWRGTIAAFPCYAIELPLPPTIDVLGIRYLDGGGIEQTVSDTAYRLVDGGWNAARVVPRQGVFWPLTACEPDAVRIEFRAGFAPSAPEIDPIRRAILMLVEAWFEPEGGGTPIPDPVSDLISNFRYAPL